MTSSHEAGRIPRWLIAASVCAALVAQMALPALHALDTRGLPPRIALTWQVPSSRVPVVASAELAAPAHDAATCPVCQCLTRTNPVTSTSVARAESSTQCAPAPAAAPVFARSAVAQSDHPPRAPPFHAVHLA